MIARVVRSGVVEATHDGAVAVVGVDGSIVARSGDIERRFFARSAVKPFQTYNALRFGGDLPPEHVAVVAASHGGDPVHVAIVQSILSGAGLSESDLRCPPAWPLAPGSARRVAGAPEPRRIWHNCSGKHAAMLRACVVQGWPVESYVDPDHPLQQANYELIAAVTGEDPGPVGIDGCGAPVFQISTLGLARGFARFAIDPEFRAIWWAMHRFPMLASGVDGADAAIARVIDAAAKRGAEGLLGVALRNRLGLVVKVWDGARRGAGVGMVAALDELGLLTRANRERLESIGRPHVLGGGEPVGHMEPTLRFEQ
jgi:L-asparaginase II